MVMYMKIIIIINNIFYSKKLISLPGWLSILVTPKLLILSKISNDDTTWTHLKAYCNIFK